MDKLFGVFRFELPQVSNGEEVRELRDADQAEAQEKTADASEVADDVEPVVEQVGLVERRELRREVRVEDGVAGRVQSSSGTDLGGFLAGLGKIETYVRSPGIFVSTSVV